MSSSACLSGLEMGVNSVCILKIDRKHDLLTISSSRGLKQDTTKPSRHTHEVAGNIS